MRRITQFHGYRKILASGAATKAGNAHRYLRFEHVENAIVLRLSCSGIYFKFKISQDKASRKCEQKPRNCPIVCKLMCSIKDMTERHVP